jgi:REP element-mobilizing transposase RayT
VGETCQVWSYNCIYAHQPGSATFGTFYHIFNRGNNRENLFPQERNYNYFLELWWKHTSQIAETHAYCLLKNHFHATVFIKYQEDLTGAALSLSKCFRESPPDLGHDPRKRPDGKEAVENLSGLKLKQPSQYFANFFNAYTRGINNATGRSGALFERAFERIPVTNEKYLMQLIVYIHQNPQKHQFVEDFRDWDFSSYHDLTGNAPTRLQRDKVIELFGSREDFIRIHQEIQPVVDFDDEEDG